MNHEHLKEIWIENEKKPFYIQYQNRKIKKPWKLYPTGKITQKKKYKDIEGNTHMIENTKTEPIYGFENQRQILSHEIVIDIDIKDKSQKEIAVSTVQEWLHENKLNYKLYQSGGKGYHIHHFNQYLKDKCDKRGVSRIKKAILKQIQEYINEHIKNNTTIIDLMKSSPKTLIQMENMPHHKTGRTKTLITSISYEQEGDVLSHLEDLHLHKTKHPLVSPFSSKPHNSEYTPSCLIHLEDKQLTDGKKRAMFILTNHKLKNYNLNIKKTTKEMLEWNDRQGHPFRTDTIKKHIQYAYDNFKGIVPGCNYINGLLSEIGQEHLCEDCPLNVRLVSKW